MDRDLHPRASSLKPQAFFLALVPIVWVLPLVRGCAIQLNPDGVSYLDIAALYAQGRWSEALNACWSPMYSWLAAPLIRTGIEPIWAGHILGVAFAVLWTAASLWLAWSVLRDLRLAVLAALVAGFCPQLIYVERYSFLPDLILATLATLAFGLSLGAVAPGGWGRSLLAGMAWGLAYLSKTFALPFAVLFILGTGLVLLVRRRPRAAWTWWVAAYLGLALVATPWIVLLHGKYQVWTYGTAGKHTFLKEVVDKDVKAQMASYTAEVLPYARSAFHDPMPPGSPGLSTPLPISRDVIQKYAGIVLGYVWGWSLQETGRILVEMLGLPLLALVAIFIWCRLALGGGAAVLVLIGGVALWLGLYALILPLGRYFLPVVAPLAILGLAALRAPSAARDDEGPEPGSTERQDPVAWRPARQPTALPLPPWRPAAQRAALGLILAWLAVAFVPAFQENDQPDREARLADQIAARIRSDAAARGTAKTILSVGDQIDDKIPGLYAAYFAGAGAKYYGIVLCPDVPHALAAACTARDVRWLIADAACAASVERTLGAHATRAGTFQHNGLGLVLYRVDSSEDGMTVQWRGSEVGSPRSLPLGSGPVPCAWSWRTASGSSRNEMVRMPSSSITPRVRGSQSVRSSASRSVL